MYKLINGKKIEMTPKEIDEMEYQQTEMPPQEPTQEERIAALEEALTALLEGATE